ncbi:MAG TPA: tetratricopeptide repeat protein, partial [Chthoniobacterales bacterium]
YTSFRLEHALWGLNATGYHWVNIILHALNALLLWRLLRALEIPGAWLGAALFALHPVHVESVAWISERKNVLMGFFFLLSLLAWQKFVAGKRRGSITFYLLALLCFAFALASKTTACMLPVALLLISWLKRGAISLARVIQVFPFVVVGLGMGLLTIWWERYHQGTQGELFAIGLFDRVLIAARAFWFYLFKLAWPAELAFSYPRFNISAADPIDYLWLGGFVALVLAIWILRRWIGRGPEVALTFFFAMLAPTLGFVMLYTFRYTFVADHYQYLASIGPLALAGAAVTMALNPLGRAKTFVLPLVCAALLVPLGLRTWQQGGVYKDEETLWRATIATNPGSWMAQNNLAVQLLSRDRYNEAIDRFEEALRLEPNYAEAHYNLGNAFFRTGQLERARTHYERALQINPRIAVAHTNLGILLSDNGDEANAIKHFEEAVKIEPRAVVAQQRLSEALVRQGRTAEAVQHFDAAAKINPASTQSDAQNEIALALLRQGRAPEAIAQAKRTIEANPNNSAAYTNYGIILAELRQADEAMAQFEKALELDPSNAQAHYNVGNTLLMQRRVEEAMARYRRAIEIQPDNAAAHLNLGNTLAEFGRADEAIAEYEKALEIR